MLRIFTLVLLALVLTLSQSAYADSTTEPNTNEIKQSQSEPEQQEPQTTPETTESKPEIKQTTDSSLPKCDGTFQDCVTRNGDTCKAGEGGEKCECADDMSDCANHPSLQKVSSTTKSHPDASCDFHPNAKKCAPDENGNCPPGFSHNDKGNCHPSGPCPTGFFRHTDDESGKCFKKHTHGQEHKKHNNNNGNNSPHILKCNNDKDQCIGWCSTAPIDGTETIFCFTKKECSKFQIENDGTKCKRTVIHD